MAVLYLFCIMYDVQTPIPYEATESFLPEYRLFKITNSHGDSNELRWVTLFRFCHIGNYTTIFDDLAR